MPNTPVPPKPEHPSSPDVNSLASPWTKLATEVGGMARDVHHVDPSLASVRTSPDILPEVPRDSGGLFELVTPIARRALELGLSARERGFHVFVAAEADVMIEDDIVRYASAFARTRDTPSDIVYVHDFEHPEAPKPLILPTGTGSILVEAMDKLIERLQEVAPTITEADDVQKTQEQLTSDLEAKTRATLHDLEIKAKTLGFGIRSVQGGVQTFPILHGKPLSAEQFDVLDESTKKALEDAEGHLTRAVEKAATFVRAQNASFMIARDEALGKAAEAVIVGVMNELIEQVADLGDEVRGYLESVREALISDWEDLIETETSQREDENEDRDSRDHDPELATRLNRFKVNLLVSHEPGTPAPVLYETNPTYPKLFGYLERRARYGALLTDFTRIRPGTLHWASGGVLVIRAADLLADPIIWERMKRVLRERRLGAEDPLGPLGLYATTLRPVAVPIQVRVVLVGTADLYANLREADADFGSLFRIKAEVEPAIPRTTEAMIALDAYLMAMAKERDWGQFDRAARAHLLDLATRLAGDRERLALSLSPLEETAAFASAHAAARVAEESTGDAALIVTAPDVELAWRERRDRLGAAERHIREITLRGEVALDTEGTRVGVVNGLSVYSTGDVEFGQPMRITAVVALGREGIVDVEREAQLGGSIHTKGVAILRGYLARMFGQERPLSLRAQIAFEQSYGEIEGDSASSSELFAVLSALADVGIDQGVAVTGSVNQLGEMQAIGGVCAKIEGFFDLCAARGLNGSQGVLIPRVNLPHLVLRNDVAEAIEAGRFHLYCVDNVAQGIEVLTGLSAGDRDAAGRFPAGSIFGRVERRIIEIAERLRQAEGHGPHHEPSDIIEDPPAERSDPSDFAIR